jgi:tungstate transport system substrate-binding protein
MAHGLLTFLKSAALSLAALASAAQAGETIVLASTTSTEQSGLFNFILPIFEKHSGIAVKVVALGTGQALDVGRRGDADVLLVHDRAAEDKFVAEGYGVGSPGRDVQRLRAGRPGGRHGRRERREGRRGCLRPHRPKGASLGVPRRPQRHPRRRAALLAERRRRAQGQGWYKEAGAGMGPTLNMAAGMGAYTLADRGTWASFKNRQDLAILYAGDPKLYNPYGVMLVNPAKHPHVKRAAASASSTGSPRPKAAGRSRPTGSATSSCSIRCRWRAEHARTDRPQAWLAGTHR